MQTVVKLNFNRSTRFTQILARLGQATKLRIVVDWDALLDAGWTPETMARLTVDGKPLAEALTMLLGPRDLVYRLVDDTTLEITTPVAAAQHVELELYDVSEQLGKELDPQPIIEQWQERIGIREFREQGGAGVIRFDPVSRCILLAQPYALNLPPP